MEETILEAMQQAWEDGEKEEVMTKIKLIHLEPVTHDGFVFLEPKNPEKEEI